jgi:hypothetical protein
MGLNITAFIKGVHVMKTKKTITASVCASVIAALLGIAPATTWSQDDESAVPRYVNFRIQTVKQDRDAEWRSLRKEMMEANKKAGRAFYHVYQRLRGPSQVYLIVSPEQGMGEQAAPFEPLPDLNVPQSWFDAIGATLDRQLVLTLRSYPDLWTLQGEPSHPSENFVHLRIRTALPGRSADFEEWLGDDLIPALRSAQVGDVRVLRVVLGESPRTWVTASFVPGWPEPQVDIDQRMLRKGDSLAATWTDYFYEFIEDLSFTAD